MLFIAFVLCWYQTGKPISKADQAILNRVNRAVKQLNDKRASMRKFESRLPKSKIPTWRRLLKQTRPNSQAYAELSFTLAYYGTDYDKNLYRLLRPYRVWCYYIADDEAGVKNSKWEKEYASPNEISRFTDLDSIVFALNMLYLKHHDLKSLRKMLEMKLDGHWAEEQADTIGELWKRHSRDLLHAASGSSVRINELADALRDTGQSLPTLQKQIHTAAGQDDKRLLATAKAVEIAVDKVLARSKNSPF